MFKYGDKVIITNDKDHDGFYEGVEGVVIAQMLEENKAVIIGEKKPVTYSVVLPKVGDKERYLEVKEGDLQKR